MKKLKYNKVGQFTKEQERLCKEIKERLDKLAKSGCSVVAKSTHLEVFKTKELRCSQLENPSYEYTNDYPIPYLYAGHIHDAGADDTEFFVPELLDFDE